jgi:chloramphenicol O-acetyltransferase type A
MKQRIDIDTWIRKPHYLHFKDFDEPFYGVCVSVDCTKAYQKAKEMNASFYLYYLHKSLLAAKQVEAFCYRIENNQVFLYDECRPTITVDRPDGTFGFGYIDFFEDFGDFQTAGKNEIEKVRKEHSLVASGLDNVIHYSAAPWINFTSLSHPRRFSTGDSCPKITFGKLTDTDGKKLIPVAIHVHHALVDGRDIGEFVDIFQKLLNE